MQGSSSAESTAFFGGRARLLACPCVTDSRGSLLPFEFADLPFTPRRVFAVTGAPAGTARGGHAHRKGEQFLVSLHGRIEALIRVGPDEASVLLSPGGPGLLFGPGVWCRQTYLDDGAVLLAFASEPYDPTSYDPAPDSSP